MSNDLIRIPVVCRHCGARVGEMVNRDGAIYLDVGVFLASAGMRYCSACGRPFHFHRPKREWRVLVQEYQQTRTTTMEAAA